MAAATTNETKSAPPPIEKIKVKVDGRELEVPKTTPDPISPGMEIYTNTPAVKQMREGVLEFLLINHPLDCPICDQAGECKLQEYSVEYGRSESRFVEAKVHKPKRVDLGPRIVLDDERCILCTRCVGLTKDIVGDDALGMVNRGSYNTLTAYPGKIFDKTC